MMRHAMPPAVNYHLLTGCNMRCKGCFATFEDVRQGLPKGLLSKADTLAITRDLAKRFSKITFAGGEPTLVPWLHELIAAAKAEGATTMLVTNGSRVDDAWLDAVAHTLDWLTLSIDSPDPETHVALGRTENGRPMTTERYVALAQAVRDRGLRFKVNTVVSKLNQHEDFAGLLMALRPERWKLFQILPIEGQNDGSVEPLLIERAAFTAFVARHNWLSKAGVVVVPEDNAAMTGTYAMVSPDGRFYDNAAGRLRYTDAILEVGLPAAWQQTAFDPAGFEARGGHYDWGVGGLSQSAISG